MRSTQGTSLADLCPHLISEWGAKNERPPSAYTPGSNTRVWWICSAGHEWQTAICNRAKLAGTKCRTCWARLPRVPRASPDNNLKLACPDLASEWHPTKNKGTPETCTPRSHLVAWWTCSAGHEWEADVSSRTESTKMGLRKRTCPYCTGHRASDERNLTLVFPAISAEWHPTKNSVVPNELAPMSGHPAWWRCTHGHEWQARVADRTQKGSGCPRCKGKVSRAESEIMEFVKQTIGSEDVFRTKKVIPPLELDVWVPALKVAIECDGTLWHSETFKTEESRPKKLRACEAAGIRLITVFESDWALRRPAVQGYLRSVLGADVESVGARTLGIRNVAPSEAQAFLEAHHVLGADVGGGWCRGLYRGQELLALARCRQTRPRHAGGQEPRWELTRYCVASGVKVLGGFARLWAAFLEEHTPDRVVTFADLRWSRGELYGRHGFVRDGRLPPSYWYFRKNTQGPLYHKSSFTKDKIAKKLGPLLSGETEKEAMLRFGWCRIYDLGLDRWVWTRT